MNLNFSDYRDHVDEVVEAVLRAVEPQAAVKRYLRREGQTLQVGERTYGLHEGRVFLVSVGKAALPMARAAVDVLGDDLTAGVVVAKEGTIPATTTLPGVTLFTAGHPVSNESSLQATAAVYALAEQAGATDLVLCLVSGGTSALLTSPLLPLDVWQQLLSALLASGCSIQEFNQVRRQLDRVKGGGLARRIAPATCMSLILSDVIGNDLASIGSGPTVPTPAVDAEQILQRYGVVNRLETAVWQQVKQALRQPVETIFATPIPVYNAIIGDVRQAAQAAFKRAAQLGFLTQVLTTHLEGEARQVGQVVAALAKDIKPSACYILAGETTVTLQGDGVGGRNQELALAAALALAGQPDVVVATLATDGEDGTTGAAGAVVTGETIKRGHDKGLDGFDYLNRNDSHTFFSELDREVAQAKAAELSELEPVAAVLLLEDASPPPQAEVATLLSVPAETLPAFEAAPNVEMGTGLKEDQFHSQEVTTDLSLASAEAETTLELPPQFQPEIGTLPKEEQSYPQEESTPPLLSPEEDTLSEQHLAPPIEREEIAQEQSYTLGETTGLRLEEASNLLEQATEVPITLQPDVSPPPGHLIYTGATGTNVNDLVIVLAYPHQSQ